MWWNDNRANIFFLNPDDSVKLKKLPLTTADLRRDYFAKNRQKDFEQELIQKCGFTQETAKRIADGMWEAMRNDSYFVESLKKEEDSRKGIIVLGEVYYNL